MKNKSPNSLYSLSIIKTLSINGLHFTNLLPRIVIDDLKSQMRNYSFYRFTCMSFFLNI